MRITKDQELTLITAVYRGMVMIVEYRDRKGNICDGKQDKKEINWVIKELDKALNKEKPNGT